MSHPKFSSHLSRIAEPNAAAVAKPKPSLPKISKDKSAAKAKPDRKPTCKLSYLSLYRASPLERIALIKKGVLATEVKQLFGDLHIGQSIGFKALNLSVATVNKKAKNGEVLSSEESERVIGLARLVGQLEAIVQESGDGTDFDSHAWLGRWLTEPLPAFEGVPPADLIDTMEGQALVSSTLAKLQSGAYA